MSLTIGSNIASLQAQRRLFESSTKLETVFERLSSGQRINRASDDAAGLAISESLRTDQRVFTQGTRNLNDGLSLLNIADSTIEQLSNIVIRLQELSEQSANGSLGSVQRQALDEEAQELSQEYTRIIRTTKFNGRSLFDGELGTLRLQGGYGLNGAVASGLGGALGNGVLGGLSTYLTEGLLSNGLAVGDLNGDGNLDIVTGGRADSPEAQVTIQLGNGDGTFSSGGSFLMSTSTAIGDIHLADINNDGVLDLLSRGSGAGGTPLYVSLGAGDGTFQSATSFDLGTLGELALEDINGDGNLDVVSVGTDGGYNTHTTVAFGDGSGSFDVAFSRSSAFGVDINQLALADLNGDGILDLLAHGDGGLLVSLGNSDGSFGSETGSLGGTLIKDLELADFNGDGALDIVLTDEDGTAILSGDGTGNFGPRQDIYAGGGVTLFLNDLNGDGIQDLVLGDTPRITVLIGQADGSFSLSATYSPFSGGTANGYAIADFNNDGVSDLAYAGTESSDGILGIRLQNTTDGIAPLLDFDLSTLSGARQALPRFSHVLDNLSSQRGIIGAFQSRLASASNVLAATTENYAAAESRIRDADIATEAASLVRLNILQQAGAAVLSQANVQPQLALQLLSGL